MVRTRIAPSPTGFPHIGTIYQALFDYAFARKYEGQFIVRVEDTDRTRFVEGAEQNVLESLEWFGLIPDESPVLGGSYGPYRQSERLGIYKKFIFDPTVGLLYKSIPHIDNQPCAYYCFCTKERLEEMRNEQEKNHQAPMYDKKCLALSSEEVDHNLSQGLSFVIRLNVPRNTPIVFNDSLVGEISFDGNTIDDQVLMKSDGFPTYHFGVVVDDHLMNVTHVFRGREWLPSTPKHILLYYYFDWIRPIYVHLPVILNSEGKGKLSKRHGHASVTFYKELGYLPEAILNYLSNIVWNHPEGKEIYSLEEFIRVFHMNQIYGRKVIYSNSLEGIVSVLDEPSDVPISSQGPKFDLKKLDWMNGEYIRNVVTGEDLVRRISHYSKYSQTDIAKVLPLVRERLVTLSEFDSLVLFFFEDIDTVLKEDFTKVAEREGTEEEVRASWKKSLTVKNYSEDECKAMLSEIYSKVESIDEWTKESLEATLRGLVESSGWKVGELFMMVRVAVTGRTATPPLFESMEIIGREVCLDRIKKSYEL